MGSTGLELVTHFRGGRRQRQLGEGALDGTGSTRQPSGLIRSRQHRPKGRKRAGPRLSRWFVRGDRRTLPEQTPNMFEGEARANRRAIVSADFLLAGNLRNEERAPCSWDPKNPHLPPMKTLQQAQFEVREYQSCACPRREPCQEPTPIRVSLLG